MKKNEIILALEPVLKVLEELSISYFIGGSIASSAYGIARATLDVDMIIQLKPFLVERFVEKLKDKYYIDDVMISEALKTNSSFNILHLETMLKIDFFTLKNYPYDLSAFERRNEIELEVSPDSLKIFLNSPEDVILSKLQWFKLSDETSEKQWTDILGVVKVQKEKLDLLYLTKWAKQLDLFPLLEKVLAQADLKL
jgi:hypothetical protein